MIVDQNIDVAADIQFSKLEGGGFGFSGVIPGRQAWYVDSVKVAANTGGGDSISNGNRSSHPFATVAFAVKQAGLYDTIHVQPGHTETIGAADAWLWAQNGIRLIGYGEGDLRPTITFDTVTTATILMDKTGLVIKNFRFVVGIDALVMMIDVTSPACKIIDCEFILDDSSFQALIGVNLGNVAADRCKILHNRFEALTIGCDEAIEIAEACDGLEVAYNLILGDFAEAGIHNPTAKTALNVDIHDNRVRNTQTGDHAIELVSNVTGDLTDNKLFGDSLDAILDPGACRCAGNLANIGSDQGSIAVPIGPSSGLITSTTALLPTDSGATSLFTITGGNVEIVSIVGEIGVAIQAATCNTKLVYNPTGTGTSSDICAVLDLTAAAVGILLSLTGTFAGALAKGAQNFISKTAAPATMAVPISMGAGVIEMNCSATVTGDITWTVVWRPLEIGATLVVA